MGLLRAFEPMLEDVEDEAVSAVIAGPEIALAKSHQIEGTGGRPSAP
jgi:hypothetical protein